MKKTLRIECPFCKSTVEVDALSGAIIDKWKKHEVDPSKDQMKEALERVGREKSERAAKFQQAKNGLGRKKKMIEDAFKEKLKKVKEEGDDGKPPLRPIDLD